MDKFEGGERVRENRQEPVHEFEGKKSISNSLTVLPSPEEAFITALSLHPETALPVKTTYNLMFKYIFDNDSLTMIIHLVGARESRESE